MRQIGADMQSKYKDARGNFVDAEGAAGVIASDAKQSIPRAYPKV
jgi:hypothetical protein